MYLKLCENYLWISEILVDLHTKTADLAYIHEKYPNKQLERLKIHINLKI